MFRGVTHRRIPGAGTVVPVGPGINIRPADGGDDVVVVEARSEDLGPLGEYLAP